MMLAHKIALRTNNKQKTYFAKATGIARFAYNWALSTWKEQYQEYKEGKRIKSPSQGDLRKILNSIKGKEFPWMGEVTKCAPEAAIKNLGTSFTRFFQKKARYPKYKKKGIHDSFYIDNTQFSLNDRRDRIRIAKLGWVRMREALRFEGKIMSATVSRQADRWFVSITVEVKDLSHLRKAENQGSVGVDLGVSSLATLSTGEKVEGPKPLEMALRKLRRLSRALSRKKQGSQNRIKARKKLAKLHARISNIRKDSLHKLSSDLTRRFERITIEDLDVKAMMQNKWLSRRIGDMGFYEFKRQLRYKADMRGNEIREADRYYASSQLCSQCGRRRKISLRERTFTCSCGYKMDRDVNAAINLKNYAVSSTVKAFGVESSGLVAVSSETIHEE